MLTPKMSKAWQGTWRECIGIVTNTSQMSGWCYHQRCRCMSGYMEMKNIFSVTGNSYKYVTNVGLGSTPKVLKCCTEYGKKHKMRASVYVHIGAQALTANNNFYKWYFVDPFIKDFMLVYFCFILFISFKFLGWVSIENVLLLYFALALIQGIDKPLQKSVCSLFLCRLTLTIGLVWHAVSFFIFILRVKGSFRWFF